MTAFSCTSQIIVSVAEHHSVIVPMQMLAQRTGATLRHVGLTADQRVDVEVRTRPHPPEKPFRGCMSSSLSSDCLLSRHPAPACRLATMSLSHAAAVVLLATSRATNGGAELAICHLRWSSPASDAGLQQLLGELRSLCCPPQALKALLGPKTKLVATVHVSNMLGSVTDVADLADAVHTVCPSALPIDMIPSLQPTCATRRAVCRRCHRYVVLPLHSRGVNAAPMSAGPSWQYHMFEAFCSAPLICSFSRGAGRRQIAGGRMSERAQHAGGRACAGRRLARGLVTQDVRPYRDRLPLGQVRMRQGRSILSSATLRA